MESNYKKPTRSIPRMYRNFRKQQNKKKCLRCVEHPNQGGKCFEDPYPVGTCGSQKNTDWDCDDWDIYRPEWMSDFNSLFFRFKNIIRSLFRKVVP